MKNGNVKKKSNEEERGRERMECVEGGKEGNLPKRVVMNWSVHLHAIYRSAGSLGGGNGETMIRIETDGWHH